MTKKEKINRLIGDIHYQAYRGVTTIGRCSRCQTASARGSGTCLSCLTVDLTDLVGADKAFAYVKAVKDVKNLELEFRGE